MKATDLNLLPYLTKQMFISLITQMNTDFEPSVKIRVICEHWHYLKDIHLIILNPLTNEMKS